MELLSYTCPRCAMAANEEFYGPCGDCITALRLVGGVQVEVEAVAYVPKMNVTPNFVGTKD